MPEVLLILQLAIEVAFALLAIRTFVSWVGQPDRRHGSLALALGSLAILILIAPLLGGKGTGAQLLTDVGLVMFLISGYGLLMFRDSFVPFRPRTTRLITAAIVAIGLLGIVLELPANPEVQHSPVQSLVLRSEEHTSELQSQSNLVCRLLLEKKKHDRIRQSNLSAYPDFFDLVTLRWLRRVFFRLLALVIQCYRQAARAAIRFQSHSHFSHRV